MEREGAIVRESKREQGYRLASLTEKGEPEDEPGFFRIKVWQRLSFFALVFKPENMLESDVLQCHSENGGGGSRIVCQQSRDRMNQMERMLI